MPIDASGLRLIACGGTFDKIYDPLRGKLVFGETHLHAIVARARLTVPVVVEPLMRIDSLDMQPSHRAQVLAACERSAEMRIVIVHGTDTMPETAGVLGTRFGADETHDEARKTIVLTGAMVPYAITQSDALFNLGFACASARLLAPGVWIAMNGQIHRWDAVRKNRAAGVFESTA